MCLIRKIASSLAVLGCLGCAATLGHAKDYEAIVSGRAATFDVTAQQIFDSFRADVTIFWIGKVDREIAFSNQDGKTMVIWLCSQHPLIRPERSSLTEPIELRRTPAGHFVVSLQMPTLTPQQAEQFFGKLKDPKFIFVVGRPRERGRFANDVPSVMLETDEFRITDELVFTFVD